MSVKKWLLVLLAPTVALVAVVAVLVAAGGRGEAPSASDTGATFPDFVYSSPKAERGYRLALENQDLFPLLPCYCGCGVMPEAAHRHLLQCFLNDDGTFDSHASGCEICVDIAIDAARWRAENKGPGEIRRLVDAKYQGFGAPTDTPPVAE